MHAGAPDADFSVLLTNPCRFALIGTHWYADLVAMMMADARRTLEASSPHTIDEFQVPGSFELPLIARKLAPHYHAVICFGCVVRGETRHNEYVSQAVTAELLRIGVETQKPVILGVLTTENHAQAQARVDGTHSRKGEECARAAALMVALLSRIRL